MTKRILLLFLAVVGIIALGVVGMFAYRNLRGIIPAVVRSPADIVDLINRQQDLPPGENRTDFPLSLPDGFRISVLADDLPNARVLAVGPHGNLWVSQPREGMIHMLQIEGGQMQSQHTIFSNFNKPHGLAFDPDDPYLLYIAEEDGISRVRVYSDGPVERLVDLPAGGRHTTRSLAFAADGTLLVSIGSSCDTCYEDDPRRGSVQALVFQNGAWALVPYATGLRNAVFMARHPESGDVWVTEMGRDFLGDNMPPDEINILQRGAAYGWPMCFGQQVHDTQFDANIYVRNPCEDTLPAYINLPAHVAPLGLTFVPAHSSWPEAYWGDLLVAYHGSWNRSVPTGYTIVRFDLDADGAVVRQEDFLSGWLTSDGKALGRPVDVLARPDGTLFISDDKAGLVYAVTYVGDLADEGIASFEECAAAGNAVMESYPRQCRANGTLFVENIGNDFEKQDSIRIDSPRPNAAIASPLRVVGEARGSWYFEGSFPIELRDANGRVIGKHYATAERDWMSEDFVSFSADFAFAPPATEAGELVLIKDNPSGLPEYDDALVVPVQFDRSGQSFRMKDGCVISGCSAEICGDTDVVSACIFYDSFACYEGAICERQENGACGWTGTPELVNCLEQYEE